MIRLIENRTKWDCCERLYRRAIYNTLLELKPVNCCEIGTYTFQSSFVFSQYFDEKCPQGKLITLDISKWNRGLHSDHIYPTMIYPYIEDIEKYHNGINIFHQDYKSAIKDSSPFALNMNIIKNKMGSVGIDHFDFIFVDGDHTKISFLNDLKIAKNLVSPEGYILIDDVKDDRNEQYEVYNSLKEDNIFYEYDDWAPNPGLALIQNKELRFDYL